MEKQCSFDTKDLPPLRSELYHKTLADFLKVLAHPIRLKILEVLSHGKRCVCEIEPQFEMSQASISKHLKVLLDAGIIIFKRDGTRNMYEIKNSKIFDLLEQTDEIIQSQLLIQEKELQKIKDNF